MLTEVVAVVLRVVEADVVGDVETVLESVVIKHSQTGATKNKRMHRNHDLPDSWPQIVLMSCAKAAAALGFSKFWKVCKITRSSDPAMEINSSMSRLSDNPTATRMNSLLLSC